MRALQVLTMPAQTILRVILPLVWKCVLFLENHDIHVEPALKIVLPKALPFTSQPSKFNAVCKLSFFFNVLFQFSKEFYPPDC